MPSIALDLEQQVHHCQQVRAEAKKIIGPADGRDARRALADRLQLPPQPITIRDDPTARRRRTRCPAQPRARRTGCLAIASRHSGFCMASRFRTGRPLTASRAAVSERLPLNVTGSAATWTISAGTKAGEPRARGRSESPSPACRRAPAGAQHDQQYHARAARLLVGLLLHRHRLAHPRRPEDAVDLRRPDADAADVQHAVRSAGMRAARLGA